MAIGTSIKFGEQLVLIGDAATPTEAFVAPCGVTDLALTVNIATNETNVPDCTDPDLPSWLVSDVVSLQMALSGSGVLTTEALPEWARISTGTAAGQQNNIQFTRNTSVTAVNGTFEAPAILTTYNESATRGQRWQIEFGFALNGQPTFTAAT